MGDDDLYLNSGDSYDVPDFQLTTPKERIEAEANEVAAQAGSFPIMPAVYNWFEEQIVGSRNIQNVQVTSLTVNGVKYGREVSIEAQVLAYQLLHDLLVEKQTEFQAFKPEES